MKTTLNSSKLNYKTFFLVSKKHFKCLSVLSNRIAIKQSNLKFIIPAKSSYESESRIARTHHYEFILLSDYHRQNNNKMTSEQSGSDQRLMPISLTLKNHLNDWI